MAGPAARRAGFTLIELLVVLVLIGIVTSIAVLSVGSSGEGEVELEARRLGALMALASEEAVLRSREMGIAFTAEGYQFLALGDDNAWVALNDEVFRPRTLPAGFSLRLSVDGLPVDIAKPKEKPEPQVFLLSDGERTAFEVDLGVIDGVRYRITAPVLGDLQVAAAAERP
ncbi:MAG: type II secretion system minor pseudopilin GspH [Thiohalomonadaceae bacterium]